MNTLRALISSLAVLLLITAAPAADDDGGRRGRGGPPSITLYERPNFGGASLEVELDQAVLDLALLRFPNGSRVDNKVSSIHIGRGAHVRIYADDKFRGEFLDLTRSVENLAAMSRAGGQTWNDALSSLRVHERRHGRRYERDPSRTPRIIVFGGRGFGGEAFEVFPGESFDDLYRERFEGGADLNDVISSVRVVGPVRVRLYTDKKLRGEVLELTEDAPDLYKIRLSGAKHSWNDRISSLVVEWVGPPRRLDLAPDGDDRDDDHRDSNRSRDNR